MVSGTKMTAESESDRCAPLTNVAPLPEHVQLRGSSFLENGTFLMNCSVTSLIFEILFGDFVPVLQTHGVIES